MPDRRSPSYFARTLIGVGVLYWALRLSSGDRNVIDWIVIVLVSCATLFSLVRFAQTLGSRRDGDEPADPPSA